MRAGSVTGKGLVTRRSETFVVLQRSTRSITIISLLFLPNPFTMTKAILRLPGKENIPVEINSPSIRALNSFQEKQLPPDNSWDNPKWVRMGESESENAEVVFERDRPEERHKKLKKR